MNDEQPYYTTSGEFSGAETTFLEVWAQMREPGPGEYTVGSPANPITICVEDDGQIRRASSALPTS